MDFNPQFMPDYVYVGRQLPESPTEGIQYIIDADLWEGQANTWPAFKGEQLPFISGCSASLKFLFITYMGLNDEVIAGLKYHPEVVLVAQSNHPNRLGEYRALAHQLMNDGLKNPLVFFQHYAETETENLQIKSAADMGALIIDGLCDGIFLFNQAGKESDKAIDDKVVDTTAFGILQAGRIRTSKTEYISCPGCGRTLYDLESTIARIKQATSHLKGLKIGIMGCIVNGPGEMADADYGYVSNFAFGASVAYKAISVGIEHRWAKKATYNGLSFDEEGMDYDAPDFEDVIESDKWKMKSKSFRVFLSFRY